MKQKITTHLWFDKEAKEAAKFYTSVFRDSKIKDMAVIRNAPSGDTDIVNIELYGDRSDLKLSFDLFSTRFL